jgi:hypothetical protein
VSRTVATQNQQDKLCRGEAGGETPRSVVLLTDGLRFGAEAPGRLPRVGFCGSSLLLLLAWLGFLICTGDAEDFFRSPSQA